MNQTIGRYQIEAILGRGGMGVVYKAFDPALQRTVALKVLVGVDDADARERLMREARAAGQLAHKNIIVIHDLGEDQGQPYVAMEYLSGTTLGAHLRGNTLPLDRVVDLMAQVCDGLEYAHRREIVHRDIKPGNLFVTEGGDLKIVDFGLVQLVSSSLTRTHTVMGTACYMAPEQVRGERVDRRADLFSAGAVLYEMVAGRRAFSAESVAATMYKIIHESPEPLERHRPFVPAPLAAIVERALAKDPARRYQDASEMRRDLEACRGLSAPRSQVLDPSDAPTMIATAASAPTAAHSSVWSPRRVRSTAIVGAILAAAFVGTLLWAPSDLLQPESTIDGGPDSSSTSPIDAPPPDAAAEPTPAPAPDPAAATAAPPQPDRPRPPASATPPPAPSAGATVSDADRQAVAAAAARVEEARSAADAADAVRLAPAQYRAAVALEDDANALAAADSVSSATARFVEAEARFRASAIEARAVTRARSLDSQPAAPPPAPPPAAPPEPARAETRPPEPPKRAPETEPAPPRAAESKPATEAAPPPRTAVNTEAAVRETVAQYVAGLEARDLAALKRVWPTLTGAQERAIQAEFANARSVQARFTDSLIEFNGDVATVSGIREYRLVTQDGQQLSTVTRTTLTMRRAGDAWHIDRIVHQPR